MPDADAPRGERNNNPTNLEDFGIKWDGLADPPHDPENYCTFIDAAHGLRAGAKNLLNQQLMHGLRTVADILPKFAPAKDHNNLPAYIADVVKFTGWTSTQSIDLRDPGTLAMMEKAIIHHECGRVIYTDDAVAAAVAAAYATNAV